MKKIFSFLFTFLLASVFTMDSLAQSFYTGSIGINLNNFGRVRVFSDNLTTRQVDRSSVLVGVSSTAVFDYTQDAGTVTAATTVASPTLSDHEVTGVIDNSDSNLPPNVEVAINIYGWNNGAYAVVKMNVKNREAGAVDAVIGIEVIPQVDGIYGNETVQWHAASQSVLINKTNWVGYKFFSAPQTSLKSINWTSGYGNDASFFQWLTQNSFDPPFTAGNDGAVAILGQAPINIEPGQSVDFWFGIALGADQAACISNMSACEVKYLQIVPVELTSFTASVSGSKVSLFWSTANEVNNLGFEVERRTSDSPEWITIGFREGKGTTTEAHEYIFTDDISGQNAEMIYYRLKQIDFNGTITYFDEIEVQNTFAPDVFVLEQNFPNPFNPSTKISFGIPERTNVMLKVFNLIGQEVAVLASGVHEAGTYYADFDASVLSSGVYIYTLQTESSVLSQKMTLMK